MARDKCGNCQRKLSLLSEAAIGVGNLNRTISQKIRDKKTKIFLMVWISFPFVGNKMGAKARSPPQGRWACSLDRRGANAVWLELAEFSTPSAPMFREVPIPSVSLDLDPGITWDGGWEFEMACLVLAARLVSSLVLFLVPGFFRFDRVLWSVLRITLEKFSGITQSFILTINKQQ